MRARLSNTRKSRTEEKPRGESQNRSIAVVNRRREEADGRRATDARKVQGRQEPSKNEKGRFDDRALPLGDNRRRGFTLADVLRAASDAQKSQHRGHFFIAVTFP